MGKEFFKEGAISITRQEVDTAHTGTNGSARNIEQTLYAKLELLMFGDILLKLRHREFGDEIAFIIF